MAYIYDLVDTWNDGATTFTAVKMSVTNTASANLSKILDLQIGGSTVAAVYPSYTGWAGATGTATGVLLVTQVHGGGFTLSGGSSANKGLTFGSDGRIGFSSSATPWPAASLAIDAFITRRGTANLRLGDADAASPVAQTLSVQSVVAGTSNTAGTNLTITGSQGTGTGAGGSIIFQVAPAGSTGTAQNALATALTIASDRTTTLTGALTFLVSGGDTAAHTITTNSGGYITFARAADVGLALYEPLGYVQTRSDGHFGWTASSSPATTVDLKLSRDAPNTLALRNGTAAQRFNVYNTWTTSTNYEAFKIDWITTANTVLVGTEKGSGGGTARDLAFQTDGTTRLTIAANGSATFSGFTLFSGGNIRLANSDGDIAFSSGSIYIPATTRFAIGGVTSSFPALKRSSTTLQARLADDSAFASVQGKLTTETAYTAGAPTATGYLVVYDSAGTAYKIPAVAV